MKKYVTCQSAGQIITNTFQIYFRNLPQIYLIYSVPILPFIILSNILRNYAQIPEISGYMIIANVLYFAVSVFVTSMLTIAISDICLSIRPSLRRSFEKVKKVIGRFLTAYFLMIAAFVASIVVATLLWWLLGPFFGLIVGIAATVVLTITFMFAVPVAIIERASGVAALRRSIDLGRGYYLRNFGVLVLAGFISTFWFALIGMVIGVVFVTLKLNPEESFIAIVIISAVQVLVSPIMSIPIVLLYYDMRARKELYDTEALATELAD